jgi:hypothetical protein
MEPEPGLRAHEVMRRVNWVRVLVPFIMIMLAIWRIELMMFCRCEEERGVKLARWREGVIVQRTSALLKSGNPAAAQTTRYTRYRRHLHPHIHFLEKIQLSGTSWTANSPAFIPSSLPSPIIVGELIADSLFLQKQLV